MNDPAEPSPRMRAADAELAREDLRRQYALRQIEAADRKYKAYLRRVPHT